MLSGPGVTGPVVGPAPEAGGKARASCQEQEGTSPCRGGPSLRRLGGYHTFASCVQGRWRARAS
jgi:hypothetical protein